MTLYDARGEPIGGAAGAGDSPVRPRLVPLEPHPVQLEDGSDFAAGDVRCAVRVYERYSAAGSSRVSLTVTLFTDGTTTRLSGISSGGSQAVFFKINRIGEDSFLDVLMDVASALV